MCDLIYDVITCCVRRCDTDKIRRWQNYDWKPEKKRKYGNQRNYYI